MAAPLAHLTLCFTGTHSKTRSELTRDCAAAGIPTSDGVRARTTHLVATDNELAANTKKIQDARSKGVPIVSEEFLDECMSKGHQVDHKPYLLETPGTAPPKYLVPASGARKAPQGTSADAGAASQVMLAHKFQEGKIDPTGWWMSEKLDGVRAYWSGSMFYSRNGNVFPAPDWFSADLPNTPLDGELWGGRGQFQKSLSIAKSASGDPSRWKFVTYAVFDAPSLKDSSGTKAKYEDRLDWLTKNLGNLQFANAVPVSKCTSKTHLDKELKAVEKDGGEGIMLRQPNSRYENCRSHTLLKVKSFHDEEGIVIGHETGKGKNTGLCGALLLKTPDGRQVKVGTGLTDYDRRNPPGKGDIVTYKYFELSNSLNPRFPTFVGVRTDINWSDYCKNYKKPIAVKAAALKRTHSILFGAKLGRSDSSGSSSASAVVFAASSSSASNQASSANSGHSAGKITLLPSDTESETDDDNDNDVNLSKRPMKKARIGTFADTTVQAMDEDDDDNTRPKKKMRVQNQSTRTIPPILLPVAVAASTSVGPFDGATMKAQYQFENGQNLQIISGDLLKAEAACIVNSTNSEMQHLHGLCGAMSRAAGPTMQSECDAYVDSHGKLTEGEVCITSGGNLPATEVFHIIVPSYDGSKVADSFHRLVRSIYKCLAMADSLCLPNIAIPVVGSGASGFPPPLASRAIVTAVERYFRKHVDSPVGLIGVVTNADVLLEPLLTEVSFLPRKGLLDINK